ncbi:MAG: Bax inhibitor-1/YccA family protein [Alphaproteobacteria bacterium]|nr:Bax inhibitor-1/YccA family protein [Alphaproteobacteria bacterium]MCZ6495011.1 Bax inhibitor-1/YccA family protein [Alphaproteobacteria bacterium]MCZ6813349.1 Bax inhibitor-1/YccA family protein [Alphaproteobacteria bacterium]MCZ6848584.1 Bax inhibitor-1/YccA family protein [Alphaproteobacteria bacterium]
MTRSQAEAAQIDVGLRAHMLRVYNYMASGVALTGIVAMLASSSPTLMNAIFGTPLKWVVMLAPLAFVMVISFGINRLSLFASQALFWAFAAVMGLSLSVIFLIYTGESIARVFFITAASFGALSLWGYTTKRDISGWGSFLFIGLVGIIIAGVVNWFMQSSALQFAISVIGVLVFAGLTAYDTQKIKNEYSELHDQETSGKLAVMGALRLYLDFINLMMMLLRLFGTRR